MRLKVVKKRDDVSVGEKVLRISIGGWQDAAYITYRGDIAEVQQLLQAVSNEFTKVKVEPPISPDDGKQYS